jgi:hypothetical protein
VHLLRCLFVAVVDIVLIFCVNDFLRWISFNSPFTFLNGLMHDVVILISLFVLGEASLPLDRSPFDFVHVIMHFLVVYVCFRFRVTGLSVDIMIKIRWLLFVSLEFVDSNVTCVNSHYFTLFSLFHHLFKHFCVICSVHDVKT